MSIPRNLSKLAEGTDSSGVLGIAYGGTGGGTTATAKAALGLHAVATSGSYADLLNKPTTANIVENTNLYFTDARSRASVSASGSLSYNSATGVFSYTTPSTSGISEGTNLYYTDARARGALSASTGISYNSTTGAISTTITQYTDTLARGAVSASGDLSYNSTTGVFSYTTPSTSGIVEGTNLYFTDARARASISVTGAGSYNSTTGVINIVGGVTSFNTRTGAITLSSADVTGALGFTPYNATNPNGYLTGITSSQVTTALGFTPYNSTNPNGYITGITSSNVTTALGFTPYNATNPSGYISGITSGMVTTALGYTPYNSSNPSGYITSAALSGYLTSASAASTYLPLAGGTLSGNVTLNTADGEILVTPTGWRSSDRAAIKIRSKANTPAEIDLRHTVGGVESGWHISARDTSSSSELHLYRFNMNSSGAADTSSFLQMFTFHPSGGFNAVGALTQNGNQVLHAGNYNSYALPLSGGTLSGTLRFGDSTNGIYLSGGRLNIRSESTDNVAEYASYGLYLPKTGQTAGLYVQSPIEARGGLRIGSGAENGTITVGADTSATANRLVQRDASGHITGNYILGSYFNASAGNSENPTIGQVWTQSTGDNYLRKSTPGHFISQLGLLNTSNYSSYALPLSGGTLTGDVNTTANLSISGRSIRPFENNSFIEFYVGGDANTYYPVRFDVYAFYHFGRWSISRNYGEPAPWDPIGTGAHKGGLTLTWEWSGDGAWGGNDKTIRVVQFAESYTTMVGGMALSVNGIIVWLRGGNAYYRFHGPGGILNGATPYYSTYTASNGSTFSPRSYSASTVTSEVTNKMPVRGESEHWDGGNRVLHAGNYSSYALPLSGGTLSGAIRAPQITAGGSTNTDANLGVQGSSHLTGTIYYGGTVGNVNSWSSISTSSSGTHTFSGSRFVFDRYGYGSQALITLENNAITLSQPTIITSELTLNASNIWFNSSPSLRSNGNFSFLTNSSAAQAGRFLGVQVSTSYGGSVPSNGILFFTDTALVRNTANELDLDGRRLLHASNYSSYALPLSGGTLSGALSATSGLRSYYSDHIPGDGYGIRFWESNSYKISMGASSLYQYGTVTDYSIKMQMDNGSPGRGFTWGRESFAPVAALNGTTGSFQTVGAVKSGNNMSRPNASWGSSGATGMAIFKLPGGSGNYGMVHMVFDIYEYNGNSVSTVIVGGHNWAGSWYNIGANVIGQCGKQVRLGFIDGQYCVVFGDGSSYWEYGQVVLRKIQNGEYYNNIMDLGAAFSVVFTASASFSNISGDLRALRTPASFNAGGAITQAGNQVLHAGNYTNYTDGRYAYARVQSNWNDSTVIGNVVGMLAWKNYGNSHVIFDASNGTTPSGSGCSTTNPTYAWGSSYPTLMGWNGGNTYGVRVDSSRYSDRAARAQGNFYIDDNYGNGIVGAYASTRYQGVFFMGDAYKMSDDGTSLANMYGIGWSHPNAGGAAGNLTDHGMLIINNGGFRCAISNSIVASGNITAYSDERLKTNWRDMPENYVTRLAQVKVGIYDRIDEKEMSQVGVSAQSFQKLLPEAILTAKDEMQTLSVSYGNAALASSVELAKEVVDLKTRVAQLEALIEKLIKE
jgi:predicted RecA/RadA family phage recombinase